MAFDTPLKSDLKTFKGQTFSNIYWRPQKEGPYGAFITALSFVIVASYLSDESTYIVVARVATAKVLKRQYAVLGENMHLHKNCFLALPWDSHFAHARAP